MAWYRMKFTKHCRWCGKAYEATKPHGKDGFCCPACKQAHHRAYKKYVTGLAAVKPGARRPDIRKK